MGCGQKAAYEEEMEERQQRAEARAKHLGIPLKLGTDIERVQHVWNKHRDNLPFAVVVAMEDELNPVFQYGIKK